MTDRSVDRSGRKPLHIEDFDSRVINVRGQADEKQDLFLVCLRQGIEHAKTGDIDGHDLLEADAGRLSSRVCHAFTKRPESSLSSICEPDILSFDSPDATGGEHLLVLKDRVVDQELSSVEGVLDRMALKHERDTSGAWLVELPRIPLHTARFSRRKHRMACNLDQVNDEQQFRDRLLDAVHRLEKETGREWYGRGP
jgi:hypothetical protein